MKSLLALLIAATLWPAVTVQAAADDSPAYWLDKMSRGFRDLSYQGTFTFEQGDTIEALKITHMVIDGKEYGRLEHMDGQPREVIRRGHSVQCLHPGHNLLRGVGSIPIQTQAAAAESLLAPYYQLQLQGQDRVAGRPVVELSVLPRDTHRYGRRLYLDRDTGLVLRSVLYGPENTILERFQFVDIDMSASYSASYFTGEQGVHEAYHSAGPENATPQSPSIWRIDWLPGGFKRVDHRGDVDMRSYTDGLATFSVFVEALTEAAASQGAEGRAKRGATAAYTQALLLRGSPHRVTVVGEIPAATAERIAASVVDS